MSTEKVNPTPDNPYIVPDEDVKVLKDWYWFIEKDQGPHFYAFTGEADYTKYPGVSAKVILPKQLEVGSSENEDKYAYISLGICGHAGWGDGFDMGIANHGEGWYPVCNDVIPKKTIHETDYIADPAKNPYSALITVEPLSTSQVRLVVQFYNSSGTVIYINGKSSFSKTYTAETPQHWLSYYHFASLLNVKNNFKPDTAYMRGGQFTDLYMRDVNGKRIPWGIDSDMITRAWITEYQYCDVTGFTSTGEKFDIDYR